jgi:hypothetical protein
MRWCRTAASVVLFLLLASSAHAAWLRLDSPNFVVIGDASERQLRDIAVKFEAFREILGRVRGNEVAIAAVPTVIIVFRSASAFEPYRPRYQGKAIEAAGLFVGGQDINHIAFVNDGTDQAPRVMYHEYAHLVISNAAGRIPVWLNEGLAEVYSTFELTRDGRQALIGRPIGEHLGLLSRERLLKLPELLQVEHSSPLYNEGERRSVFYAQAWALVHMINFGDPPRVNQLGAYVQRLSEGAQPTEAWKEAFGADRIERELERYVSRASYKAIQHRFSDKLSRFEANARPIAPEEKRAYLAHFLLAQGRREEAANQLALADSGEQNALVRAVRAHGDVAAGDYAAAVQRVTEAGPVDDWLVAYYAGVAISECVQREPSQRGEPIQAANRFFDTAERHRVFPNAVIRRASMTVAANTPPADATILAVQGARNAAPGREDYAFVHAQLLAAKSDFRGARNVLGPLLSLSHEPRVREAARSLMGSIVTVERQRADADARRASNPAEASAAMSTSDGPSPSSSPGRPGAPLPPTSQTLAVFREVKEGEEQVDGTLQGIECRPGGAAVFVVRVSDKIVRLAARRMDQVDFITYRDDLSGSVSCGALKEPMRVYVTSRRASTAGESPAVVAVEFLPKDMQ